ncbi:MAG TPA: hypothetical protein VM123_09085 [archaeon]|nr:hypothetical protein [archaeon]
MTEKRRTFSYVWPVIVLLAWIWLSVPAAFYGWTRVWGLIPLGPYGGYFRLAVACVITALLFCMGCRWVSYLNSRVDLPGWRRIVSFDRVLLFVGGYVVIFFIGWFLRSRNHFMGDGFAFIEQVTGPFFIYRNEPLDFFLHQLFYRLLGQFGISGGEFAYSVLHILLLPFFLLVCWKIVSEVSADSVSRLALWVLIISTSSLQLFFGYAESYTLVHLWLAVYLYFGIKHLRGAGVRNPWLPTGMFLLALFSHTSGAVLFPSLLFLWLARFHFKGSRGILGVNSRWVSGVSFCCLVLVLLIFGSHALVPLSGEIDGGDVPYRMFELRHFWDKFNFLLLIAPAAAVCLFVIVGRWRFFLKSGDSAFVFVFWAAAGSFFFLFAFNPFLGVRDWDLLSLPAVPLTLLCGWSLIFILPEGDSRRVYLAVLAIASWLHASGWIWVNADYNRGVRFLDSVCEADFHQGSSKLQLGYLFYDRMLYNEGNRQFRLTVGKWRATAIGNMLEYYLLREMPDSVIYYGQQYLTDLRMDPKHARNNFMRLSLAYDKKGEPLMAADCYYSMRVQDLDLEKDERVKWTNRLRNMGMKYSKILSREPANAGVLLFFLRYYTIAQDNEKLADVYKYILSCKFTKDEWERFVNFADVCGHKNNQKLMVESALKQYPELKNDQGP